MYREAIIDYRPCVVLAFFALIDHGCYFVILRDIGLSGSGQGHARVGTKK